MSRSAADFRTGVVAKFFHEFTHPLNFFSSNLHSLSRIPTIDFSSIKELDDVVCLFRKIERMQPRPSVPVSNELLSLVVKMKYHSAALSMFDEMRQRGIPVNEFTFNIAINCYCLLSRPDFGHSLLSIIFKSGYKPDAATFSSLIKGLFLDHKVLEATTLFKKLLLLKIYEPNDVMILTMINGLCKAGQPITAFKLLSTLEKTRCKPNVFAYSALIDGFCKVGMVDDAVKLLARMIGVGISPNVVTYSSMIQGLFSVGRYADGWNLFNDMEARQVRPNLHTYTILLDGLCKTGQIGKALLFYYKMEDEGMIPDIVTYGTVINGLCKNGKLKAAIDLLNELRASKGMQPDIHIYTMIIGSLCEQGSFEEAKHLLIEMVECGCAPDNCIYNIIIWSLLRSNELLKAKLLFEEMREKGLSANKTTISMLLTAMEAVSDMLMKMNNKVEILRIYVIICDIF